MAIRVKAQFIPPEVLLQAYASGYFPMADSPNGRIEWYTADPRAVLPLAPFHVPRRLQRVLKKEPFTFTRDTQFQRVIRACSDRESTWISEGIVASYTALHERGHAHSVEVWQGAEMVGGLYGVHLGGAFFGESMFHLVDDASKAALVHLAQHLNQQGFRLLEIQMITPLTAQFGARLVKRRQYEALLAEALPMDCAW
ncbi:MAG: leucyl/phenylalanyl-tRNA--protein transferase [Actinomycetota bacterium]